MCAVPGKMCMNEMMHIDAMGGAGKESHANRERLEYDNRYAEQGVEAPAPRWRLGSRVAQPRAPEGMKPKSIAPTSSPVRRRSIPAMTIQAMTIRATITAARPGRQGLEGSDPVAPGQLNR